MLRFYPVKIHRSLPLTAAMLSLLALTVSGTANPVSAQTLDAAKSPGVVSNVIAQDKIPAKVAAQLSAVKAYLKSLPESDRKINGRLFLATAQASAAAEASDTKSFNAIKPPANVPAPRDNFNKDSSGRIRVDIRAKVTPDLINAIKAVGGNIVYASPYPQPAIAYPITVYLSPTAIRTIAKRTDVKRIREASMPISKSVNRASRALVPLRPTTTATATSAAATSTSAMNFFGSGKVFTEGDNALAADIIRYRYGLDGSGNNIGVMSNDLTHLKESQTSKDLPGPPTAPAIDPDVHIVDNDTSTHGEGTAMLEIIYDMAPGAKLYFATATKSEASFADNIRLLSTAGCNIIVDDIGWSDEPVFQDGVIAQAITDVVTKNGVTYLSAAGNDGNFQNGTSNVWEGDFNDSGQDLNIDPTFNAGRIHRFSTPSKTSLFNQVSRGDILVLQWSDPIGNSTNDYDMFVLDKDGNLADYSTNYQSGSGDDPIEAVIAYSTDKVYVVKYAGDARYLRLKSYFSTPLALQSYGNAGDHAVSEHSYGVGAADVRGRGISPYGLFRSQDPAEYFSSDGPRIKFFNPDGSDITPGKYLKANGGGKLLAKPDFVSANGVTTSFDSTSGFNPFYGTSAAAPHAAALVALLKQYNKDFRGGGMTVAGLDAVLHTGTIDIEATGWDPISGPGILMATKAVDVMNLIVVNSNNVDNITTTSARINWNTYLDSDSTVYSSTFTTDSTLTKNHSVTVTGLLPNTRYFYYVQSSSTAYGLSSNYYGPYYFTTAKKTDPPANPGPVITVKATGTRNAQGKIIVSVTLENSGSQTATSVKVTKAGLAVGTTKATLLGVLPLNVTSVPAQGQGANPGKTTFVLTFSALTGKTVTFTLEGTYANGGTYSTPAAGIAVPLP